MPLVMILLMGIMAIVATLTTGPQSADQLHNQQRAAILASQMNWYHVAAVQQCQSTTCPVGPVDVTKVFRGARINFPSYFRSAYNGTEVVTTWNTGNPFYSQPFGLGGLIAASLREQSQKSAYAGPYDANTHTVAGSNSQTYDPATGYTLVTIPADSGGLALRTGDPVLVTVMSPTVP